MKEIFEDMRRHKQDRYFNKSRTRVLKRVKIPGSLLEEEEPRFVGTFWEDLKVGDVVEIHGGEGFPADLLLLSSSEPDGFAYIETSNLDGETNLKIRQALPETTHFLHTLHDLDDILEGLVVAEKPNNQIYHFEGLLELGSRAQRLPLSEERILLRGSTLRNTKWIYAVVLYTGHDTKLMQNAAAAPIKRTFVERMTNVQILFLFIALICLALISTISSMYFLRKYSEIYTYLDLSSGFHFWGFIYQFLTFVVLYNNLIPISLVVTMEIVKFQQASLINHDLDMYYGITDTPALARTSNLVEELGQVQYLFTDKTGTLTCNKMQIKQCIIAGRVYFLDIDFPEDVKEDPVKQGKDGNRKLQNVNLDPSSSMTSVAPLLGADLGNGGSNNRKRPSFDHLRNRLSQLHLQSQTELQSGGEFDIYSEEWALRHYMTLLAICHTVIPETHENNVKYQASSPDEGALVKGAAYLGYQFMARKPKKLTLSYRRLKVNQEGNSFNEKDEDLTSNDEVASIFGSSAEDFEDFGILHVLEFNSTRKRMSVIAKLKSGKIILYTKGADSVIISRLAISSATSCPYLTVTMKSLELCATEGLRTLCLAMREIPSEEYSEWLQMYTQATLALKDRSARIDEAAELIERDLLFLGATAVEDKLQDRVPETMAHLAEAGIKIWVLTGDKVETAMNIGYACRLIQEDDPILMLTDTNVGDTKTSIINHLSLLEALDTVVLVIDGPALGHVLTTDEALSGLFFRLASKCRAVLCCRSSPIQKALVVKLVKKSTDAITLAIGDGANDVSMIQAADVGVGISAGEEGMQAARAADFAIAQFCFLSKLLLVHGAWSYQRLSKLILYSFYKNIALYMTQFWFAFFNLASGQTLYESWMITLYNVIFTFIPPIMIGVTDQHLTASELDRYPQMYRLGQSSAFFNVRAFWGWTLNAVFHSLVLFLSLYGLVSGTGGELILADGCVAGHWFMGTMLYLTVLITVLLKAALILNHWTWFAFLTLPGSLLAWFAFFPLYDAVFPKYLSIAQEIHGLTRVLYVSPVFWLFIIVIPPLCLFRDLIWKYVRRQYAPLPYHIVQEFYRLHRPPPFRPPKERIQKVRKLLQKRLHQNVAPKSRGYAFSQSDKQA